MLNVNRISIVAAGYFIGCYSFFMVVKTIVGAYLNGGTFTIGINEYGEGWVEVFVLTPVYLFFLILGGIFLFKEVRQVVANSKL